MPEGFHPVSWSSTITLGGPNGTAMHTRSVHPWRHDHTFGQNKKRPGCQPWSRLPRHKICPAHSYHMQCYLDRGFLSQQPEVETMEGPLEISFRYVDRTDELETLVRSKIEKLERVCDYMMSARVTIERHP
jgi:hypothetical protein